MGNRILKWIVGAICDILAIIEVIHWNGARNPIQWQIVGRRRKERRLIKR
jgi:hypothetical protein